MSSCPRRYASKSIRSLTPTNPGAATPEPLWFLYPPWFRIDWSHQYHTEHVSGRDRQCRRRIRRESSGVATTAALSRNTDCRSYHSTRILCDQPSNKSAVPSHNDTHTTDQTRSQSERNVLHEQRVFRKIVPATIWVPRKEHIPKQCVLERRASFIKAVNPKMLLTLLRSSASRPEKTSRGVLRIPLPDSAWRELVPNYTTSSTWRHYDGSSCIVKYGAGYVELEGSARAQELAQKYFSDARHYTRSREHHDWLAKALHGSYLPVADLPQPPVWTVRSFVDYVSIVTRPRFRRSAQRHVYGDKDSHHQAVFRILLDIFTDPLSRQYASTVALRLAVSYCRRYSEFPSTACKIWTAFLDSGLSPDVACFNQELGRCLVGKEFDRFCQRVAEMQHLDVRPDSTTWALVTTYTERRSARNVILRLASEERVDSPDARSSMVIATAKTEIRNYSGNKEGVQNFMAWMDRQFGADWLTSRVLQCLLRVGRVGKARIGLTSELLLATRQAGKEDVIDHKCIMELIEIAKKAGDLQEALKLVKNKALSSIADIPQSTIEVLFLMAWERKHINICRFFWFLGATSGRITFKMQSLVGSSLKRNTTRVEDPVEANWQLLAGKIIIGTNLQSEGFADIFPSMSKIKTGSSPIACLLDWVPDGQPRHEQMNLIQLLVERDLHAYRFYERLRRHDFVSLLDKAIALDEEWKSIDATMTMSPRKLLDQSLRINLTKRKDVIPYTGHRSTGEGAWFIVNGHKLDYHTLQYSKDEKIEDKPTDQLTGELGRLLDVNNLHAEEQETLVVPGSRGGRSLVRREIAPETHEGQAVAWQGFA